MKYTVLSFVLFLALAGCVQQSTKAVEEKQGAVTPPRLKPETTPAQEPQVREISVTAKRFSFSPDPITVNFGEKVRLNITSIDVDHGFALPDFGINERIPAMQTITIDFVADKRGTFTFSCSVPCGEGHSGMRGTLTVQ